MPVQDYLDDTQIDPQAGLRARGAARAYSEMGYGGTPATRATRVAAPKPFDPLADPRFKQAAMARKQAHDSEMMARRQLADFDRTEGAALKWKTTPGEFPGDDPRAVANNPLQSDLLGSVRNTPGSASNVAATRQMQLLAEKRQRLQAEADRVAKARIDYDHSTFIPLRDQLLSAAQTAQQPAAKTFSESDYLAPSDGSELSNRIARINADRQSIGQPPIAPGSVSAGNFTESWVPLNQRTQTPDQPETDSEGPPDFSPQDNPPGDETAYGGRDAEAQPDVPDALDEQNLNGRHAAMADDLKTQFAKASPFERLKMMFGSKGYGTNEPEMAPPAIGSESAGTKGSAFTIPKMQGDSTLAGVVNAANEFTSGLSTPENAAIMAGFGGAGALAKAGGVVGKVAQAAKTAALGGFTAQMAKDVPQQVKDAYAVIRDPKSTNADVAKAFTTPGLNAFMAALAAHGTVGEGKTLLEKGGNEPPPDFNPQFGGKFTPIGPDQLGGMAPGTANMLRKTLVQTGRFTPEDVAAMSDMETHEALQGLMRSQTTPTAVEPVDIGPRDETISNGSGVATPAEADMIAKWQQSILEEQKNAPSQISQPTGDVGEYPPGNEGRQTAEAGNRDRLLGGAPGEETASPGLPGRSGEPAVEPISSATQSSEQPIGSPNESGQLRTGSEPQQPVIAERPADVAISDQHGQNPDGRLEPSGDVQPGELRSNRDGGGEQPRGGEGNGAELPGAGVGAPSDAGRAGDAGGAVNPAERFSLESASPEQQAAEAQAAREKAAAQAQRDAITARAEKPLTGDSSNVGQGQLLSADEDLFSGKSAQSIAEAQAAHEARLAEIEKAARDANAPIETPPDVRAEEALPVPPDKTVRDMVRMSSRIRAIDKELETAKGDDRAQLLQERLQVGAEMGHAASARELEKFHANEGQPDANEIIRKLVREYGITSDKSHPMAGEISNLRESGLPKRAFRKDGATPDSLAEGIQERLNAAGITKGLSGLTESDAIERVRQAFADKAEKMPPRLEVPEIKLTRGQRAASAVRGLKLMPEGATGGHSPLSLAWDSAVETAAQAIELGEKGVDAIEKAVDHFKEAFPGATSDHVAKLERILGSVVKTMDRSRRGDVGIKNAEVDKELAAMGRPPATHGERLSFEDANNAAAAKMRADPRAGEKLLTELEGSSRPVTGEEDALLLHEQRRLKNERDSAEEQFVKAAQAGDEAAMAEAHARIAKARDDFERASNIVTKVGTESSLSLGHRRMMLKEDYSLAAMERKARIENGGKPLSAEKEAEIRKLHDQIKDAEKAHAEHVSKLEDEKASLAADLAIRKIAQGVQKEGVKPADPGKVRKFISDRAAEARARIEARLKAGKTYSGIDPTELADYAYVAAEYLAKGVDAGAQLIADFGEKIRPHLAAILEKAKTARAESETVVRTGRDISGERKSTIEKVKDRLDDGESITELGNYVRKIAEQHVRDGITDREKLIDAVHATLKEADPEITRRETMDAISGYGQFKPLNPDAVKAQLRDLKGQMQQVGKLQDMQAGQAPSKTGAERRVPSDEERRLIKQVEEAKKKGGYRVTDPAKQLKSSLDAIKTRLRNHIKDLEFQISTGKKIVRDKTSAPSDAETEMLSKQRDALKKQFDEIFKQPELTDEQKIARAGKYLDSEINRLAYQIRTQEVFPKSKAASPTNPDLEAKRARVNALKEEREYLRKSLQPTPDPKTSEEIALQAFKTRTANRIAELQEKLAKGDFEPRAPREPIKLDEEGTKLKEKSMRAKRAFDEALIKDRLAKRGWGTKAADTLVRWRRGFLLSGPITLAKLTAAAAQRFAFTPLEEAVGAAYSKALPSVAAKAPRQGGANVTAEAKAITEGFTKGLQDSADIMRTGKSQLEVLYGKGKDGAVRESDVAPHSVIDYFGQLHGALKAPVKRAEFTRSFEKRIAWNLRQGVDVTDPMVQMKIATQAYKDANASIFLQDNVVTSAYNRAIGALEQKNKTTGEVSPAGKTIATGMKVLLPIVKVPTNIAAETFQHVFGTVTGSARLANAMRRGMDTLNPEQADLIMQSLKKGSLGAAALTLGYFSADKIGGYYQKNQKRTPDDVKPGNLRLYGVDIPTWLLHNPLLETLQIGATIRRVADSKVKKSDTETQGTGSGAWAAALGLAESVPFVREMVEGGKMFEGDKRAVGDTVRSMVVPMAVQTTAGWMDKNKLGETTSRKPRDIAESVKMGIPGLRQQVPQSSYIDPALIKSLASTGITIPDITRPRIGPPNKKVGVNDEQYLQFQKDVGSDLTNRLQNALPRINSMPKERAQMLIDKLAEDAHVRARVQLELRARHQPVH